MRSIRSLILGTQKKSSITGEILTNQGGSLYMVKANGVDILARATAGISFVAGMRVVLSMTDAGAYIVGQEKIRQRDRSEVIVDG